MKKNLLTRDFLTRVESLKKEAQRRAEKWALDRNKEMNIYYNVLLAELKRIELEVRMKKLPPCNERHIVSEEEMVYRLPRNDSFSIGLIEVLRIYANL